MFGINQFSTSVLTSVLPYFDHLPVIPPDQVYGKAGSVFMAAIIGGGYGLIARTISPDAGIYPFHYMAWFATAYQIKWLMEVIGEISWNRYLQRPVESYPKFSHLIHRFSLHITDDLQMLVKTIDTFVSLSLNIRPANLVNAENIEEAAFLEMCRFRMWRVFKETILDMSSFTLAHRLTRKLHISLPNRTAIPFFLVIRSIAIGIVIVPCCHLYARFLNHLIGTLDKEDKWAIKRRIRWINRLMPDL